MSREELEARAAKRAKAERVRVYRAKGTPGYWTPSKSGPGVYYLGVDEAGQPWCRCPGYMYRASCKHLEALKRRLAREQK